MSDDLGNDGKRGVKKKKKSDLRYPIPFSLPCKQPGEGPRQFLLVSSRVSISEETLELRLIPTAVTRRAQ